MREVVMPGSPAEKVSDAWRGRVKARLKLVAKEVVEAQGDIGWLVDGVAGRVEQLQGDNAALKADLAAARRDLAEARGEANAIGVELQVAVEDRGRLSARLIESDEARERAWLSFFRLKRQVDGLRDEARRSRRVAAVFALLSLALLLARWFLPH